MSRLSGIERYLGGADNVNVKELIRGEQLSYTGVIRDSDNTPMNIGGWTLSNETTYLRGDVTITQGRGGASATATITNFSEVATEDSDIAVAAVITDSDQGAFRVDIPSTLEHRTVLPDANTNVPLVLITTSYNDNATPATIRKSRLIVVSRFG